MTTKRREKRRLKFYDFLGTKYLSYTIEFRPCKAGTQILDKVLFIAHFATSWSVSRRENLRKKFYMVENV